MFGNQNQKAGLPFCMERRCVRMQNKSRSSVGSKSHVEASNMSWNSQTKGSNVVIKLLLDPTQQIVIEKQKKSVWSDSRFGNLFLSSFCHGSFCGCMLVACRCSLCFRRVCMVGGELFYSWPQLFRVHWILLAH